MMTREDQPSSHVLSPGPLVEEGGESKVSQTILEPATSFQPTQGERRCLSARLPRSIISPSHTSQPRRRGPYLAPGRLEVPMSRGTPMKAASSPSGDVCTGRRIMEQMPTDRATNSGLGGWFRGMSEARRLGLRPGRQSPVAGRAGTLDPRPRVQRVASRRSISPARFRAREATGPECPRRVPLARKARVPARREPPGSKDRAPCGSKAGEGSGPASLPPAQAELQPLAPSVNSQQGSQLLPPFLPQLRLASPRTWPLAGSSPIRSIIFKAQKV